MLPRAFCCDRRAFTDTAVCCPALQFCCIERVIPEAELTAVRESVLEGRRQLQQVREAESKARAALSLPGRSGEIMNAWTIQDKSSGVSADGEPDPDRLPIPPLELNDIAKQEVPNLATVYCLSRCVCVRACVGATTCAGFRRLWC